MILKDIFSTKEFNCFELHGTTSVISLWGIFVTSALEWGEVGSIDFSLFLTFMEHCKARLASKRSMFQTCLDVFWDHILWSSEKFDPIIMLCCKSPVVLLNAFTWSTPVKMEVNADQLFLFWICLLEELCSCLNFEKNLLKFLLLAHFYNCLIN